MAWVFEVTDTRFKGGHEVIRALKLLKPEAAIGSEFERFQQEAALLAVLDSPNLVTIFDFGKDEVTGCLYYVMTYVDGPNLSQKIKQEGAIAPQRCVEIFSSVLAGLNELHHHTVVHRDIKPSNVFLHTDGHVRLGDLGIARSDTNRSMTKTGKAPGTVLFMSPEQLRGINVGVPSDIFSTGLTLYEALTGQSLYKSIPDIDSTSDFDVIGYLHHCGRSGEQIEINFAKTGVPDALAEIVQKACRFDPAERYQTASAMREALLNALTTAQAPAPPTSFTPVDPRAIQRIGHYDVKRYIDEGGMAWVFEVVDTRFQNEQVIRALKLLKPAAALGTEFERFQQEAAYSAMLSSQHLVTVFEVGRDEATGCSYYTMTYVDGPNLAQQIEQNGKISEERCIEIFDSLLSGLAELHLHPKKLVHRDIKPANVLSHTNGNVRLADLGIARSEDAKRQTKTDFAVGTVRYMSPEQARGKIVSATSDVFSVGLTLYEALTGNSAYDGVEGLDSTSEYDVLGYLAECGRSGGELAIDFENTQISPELADVIRKACCYQPSDRYQDASKMRAALIAAARKDTISERPSGKGPIVDPWVLKGVALLILLLVLGLGAYWAVNRANALREIQRSAALVELLVTLRERVQDFGDDLAPNVIAKFDDYTERATRELSRARDNADDWDWDAAQSDAGRSSEESNRACSLLDEPIRGRTELAAKQARQRMARLETGGAPKYTPEKWAALEGEYGKASEEPTHAETEIGCKATGGEYKRQQFLSGLITQADELEVELKSTLSRRVEEEERESEIARESARDSLVDDKRYRNHIERGKSAAAEAKNARVQGDLHLELEHYIRATREFESASLVGPAIDAEAALTSLVRQLSDASIPPDVALIASGAETDMEAGDYRSAKEGYDLAATRLRVFLDALGQRRIAVEHRDTADRSREEALSANAKEHASELFEQGAEAYANGADALENGQWKEAAAHFEESEPLFRNAARKAMERNIVENDIEKARGRAETSRTAAHESGAKTHAADELEEANNSLEQAEAAYRSGNVERSLELFVIAARLFRDAKSEADAQTKQLENAKIRLAKLRRSHSACKKFRAPESLAHCKIAAADLSRAEDAISSNDLGAVKSALDGASQELRLADEENEKIQKLVLTLTPTADRIQVERGEEVSFTASASGGNRDSIRYSFKLDGATVASTNSYEFRSDAPGEHVLTVVASRGSARSSTQTRTIVVREPPQPKKSPIPAKPPIQATPAGPCTDPAWPNRPLADVLLLYQKAFSSCNLAQLERVWVMSDNDRRGYQELCKFYNNRLDASASGEQFEIEGKRALICFRWAVYAERDGSRKSVMGDTLRTAEAICMADGWYFTKITLGCGN